MPSRSLKPYRDKRSPAETPEPFGRLRIPETGKLFVVQQHQARHLHWDLRLEIDGVLRSWAVPKGPSTNPRDKRFAAFVEDHPLDYADFEGRIPDGNYGAGYVIVWDRGIWTPLNNIREGFKKGKLLFELNGYKLHGRWTLVRMKSEAGKDWLFIKEHDQWAVDGDGTLANDSVISGLTLKELPNPRPKVSRLRSSVKKLEHSVHSKRPVAHKPMLAKSGEASDRADWIYELKYDGYRLIAEKQDHIVHLWSRNGHDLTHSFPEIAQTIYHLPVDQFVIDGEIVVHDERGVPSFSLLQQRARLSDESLVAKAAIELPCIYYAFDALQICNWDLRAATLLQRKAQLKRLLPKFGALRYSEHVVGKGRSTYQTALSLGLEGIVAKRSESTYRPGRSDAWIKVRSQKTAEFVIVGWLPNRTNLQDIGALALGEYRDDELTFIGRVGSGLGSQVRRELEPILHDLPKGAVLDDKQTRAHWVAPQLVCEVRYKEYTRDGQLRQPAFVRLRDDKTPTECVGRFESPQARTLAPAPDPEVQVTHRDKIFFPEKSLTKGDLVDYYESIAPWMLPYLKDRPLVLTRYPDGIHGKSFYQRDAPDFVPDWIQREVLWSEGAEREVHYFIVQNTASLKYLANMGTIPIHAWHSRITNLEHPDWCVLDLDPKGAPFRDVVKLCAAIGDLTDELDIPAFPKTSGASGLHVLIPLVNQLTHRQAKTFGELLARVIVNRYPDIATIARSVKNREGKVYVDYLQNGHGRLLVAPFSVRAEPAASVSMPLRWSELNGRLSNPRFHIKNAQRRMQRLGNDPLAEVLTAEADLVGALEALGQIV